MNKTKKLLENILESELEVFTNNEHYNEMGRKTRKKILEIACDIENGFFAEVGACMGTDTKLLEFLGWNGILVEPSEGLYQFCKETRQCIVENYALVSKSYQNKEIKDNQIKVFGINHLLPEYPTNSGNYKVITFSDLAKKHNIKKIDIFVLDVEGFEIEVLNGIDFEQITINNFIIEVDKTIFSLSELDNIMNTFGYKNLGVVEEISDKISDFHYKKI